MAIICHDMWMYRSKDLMALPHNQYQKISDILREYNVLYSRIRKNDPEVSKLFCLELDLTREKSIGVILEAAAVLF